MRGPRCRGFTLVELLVVIGIIAILISMLLPAINKATIQSKTVACKANLQQNYQFLLMYANANKGHMFPVGFGAGMPMDKVWPNYVFTPPRGDPPTMICPADQEPVGKHSYLLNSHIPARQIRYGATKGVSSSEIILMGEKKTTSHHYYMDAEDGDLASEVEFYRHGLRQGSNYLYMDGHVETMIFQNLKKSLDPWDPLEKIESPSNPPSGQ